ncbi:MAG: acyl-ACP--UDP-N-acetylglucosamine O-acyltransferase, partial [Pirellulaceae bacterium]
GTENKVFEHAVIGGAPQHLRAPADQGELWIGNRNLFREFVTVHRGLEPGKITRIGDDNLLMVQAHVGHDVTIGNHTILTNNVMLGGHTLIEDRAYISGGVGVHQFCRIGRNAMIGSHCRVIQDIPPYVTIDGVSGQVVGLNLIGLKRNGFTSEEIVELKQAYRLIFRSNLNNSEALEQVARRFPGGPARYFQEFLCESERGFVQARQRGRHASIDQPKLRVLAEDNNVSDASRRAG